MHFEARRLPITAILPPTLITSDPSSTRLAVSFGLRTLSDENLMKLIHTAGVIERPTYDLGRLTSTIAK